MIELAEVWSKVIKALAAVAGWIAGLLGEWSVLMSVLAIVMVMDYISGVIVAACGKSPKTETGRLDSKVGFVGLAKKGFIIIIVLLATLLDRAVGADTMAFQTAATCYYIANEGISIIENAGLMGMPVPSIVKKALEQIKDKSGEEKENE